jgi:hypothetical protein|tara:strand:- start:495 stop:1463 length:969 start_codon:yes stop_codon:yes gene_type:complete
MAVNKHFHTNGVSAIASEQSLYADLVAEAIHHRGHSVYYLDRTLVAEDNVLGEDSLSKFNNQALIEMYMEDSGGGFAGERELMSQFGLQNLSEATFVVSKTKFQEKTKQIQLEGSTDSPQLGSVQLESGTITDGTISYILNETDATDADRPFEGDAIYHPTLKKLFQINFVDHDDPFNQLDTNPVYKLRCRLFDYGSEELDTGITEIDAISDDLSIASSEYQLTLENASIVGQPSTLDIFTYTLDFADITLDSSIVSEGADPASHGESILLETGGDEYIVSEDYYIGDGVIDKTAQNDLFDDLDDTVLDFSESNPFGDAGGL